MPRRFSAALIAGLLPALLVVPCVALAQERRAQAPGAKAARLYVAQVTLTGNAAKPRGEPNGTGSITICVDANGNSISFGFEQLFVTGQPTAGHIHRGARGVSGPIVAPFTAPGPINPLVGDVQWSGTRPATKGTVSALIASPGKHYVNVHTRKHPNGAVRGQLGAWKRVQPDAANAIVCGAG
jgi:hypothetical protein